MLRARNGGGRVESARETREGSRDRRTGLCGGQGAAAQEDVASVKATQQEAADAAAARAGEAQAALDEAWAEWDAEQE